MTVALWPPAGTRRAEVHVRGARVHYALHGDGDRDLLLVHGSGAHSAWWHAVVPLLSPAWRVLTVELSGHGDSDHRPSYDGETWAAELHAVLDAVDARDPVVAAHSLGGRVALLASQARPDRFAALVLLDAGIWAPEALRERLAARTRAHVHRVYPTPDEACSRFRVRPPQPQPPAEVLAPVAAHGLRRVAGGWTWKQDPSGFPPLYDEAVARALAATRTPVTYVSGADSPVVTTALAARAAALQPHARFVRLPGAHHHLPLERPADVAGLIEEA